MKKGIKISNIKIEEDLFNFMNNEVLFGLGIDSDKYWKDFSTIVNEFVPLNLELLDKRKLLQQQIDEWHKKRTGKEIDIKDYQKFLYDIGYIVNEGPDFKISTTNTDPEISNISGPQLVVPITNARYALNAVNARWGSFYDAIYGTDVLGSLPDSSQYDAKRGEQVKKYAKTYLDKILPFKKGVWENVKKI